MKDERTASAQEVTSKAVSERKKAELELECMTRESESRIAAAAMAIKLLIPTAPGGLEADDSLGEIPHEYPYNVISH